MKKILFTLMICAGLTAQAQDTTWTKSDTKIFGSKAEKMHQDMISNTSDNRMLCRFIGFKQFYDQSISMYLQSNQYSFDNAINKPGVNTYILTRNGVYVGTKPIKVYITFYHDKNERITSGKVKGSLATLAAIFLYYWPQDAVWNSTDQLKPGVVAIKHCYGDLISFKWVNNQPVITITKDSNMTVPVTQVATYN
ncbi:hypothetical protein [Mucilaginibacter sp.]